MKKRMIAIALALVLPLAVRAQATVDLYVDPATGSDSNDGTQAEPLATFPASLDKLPPTWPRKARIHLAAGTYALPDAFSFFLGTPVGVTAQADMVGPNAVPGIVDGGAGRDLTIIGTYATDYTGTITGLTLTGSSTVYQVIDTGQAWTTDALVGSILRYIDGPAVGRAFRIRANTATMVEALTPDATPNPVAGDHFVIERPASLITFRYAAFYGTQGAVHAGMSWDGVAFQARTSGATEMVFYGLSVFMNGSTFDGSSSSNATLGFMRGDGRLGGNKFTDTDLGGALRERVGLYSKGAAAMVFWGSNATSYWGSYLLVVHGGHVIVSYMSQVTINALTAKASQNIYVQKGSMLTLGPSAATGSTWIKLDGTTGSEGAIKVEDSSTLRVTGPTSISTSAAAGIAVLTGSYASITGALTGTCNATYGVSVQTFGRATANSGVTITGASGDVAAGATTGTWAGILAGTPLTDSRSQTAVIPYP